MKMKLQYKILRSNVDNSTVPLSWTISFMGSSVTTGRDSPVEASFTALTQRALEPIFASSRLTLRVTNNAMENNPCVPYDLCVGTFAGEDADMIHWEQRYLFYIQ